MYSKNVMDNLIRSSWIRAMFEEGTRLKKIHGSENVFDFTIGNPDPDPPENLKKVLKNLVIEDASGIHRYMSNAGFYDVRERIASKISQETNLDVTPKHIVMTCGAAGGLNVTLKTILNPGEEVIVFSPYFVEYLFYIGNHGGIGIPVPTRQDTFEPDIEALFNAINEKTRAIIINSPNNPTGIIYKKQTLKNISDIIESKQKEFNTNITVISDEPYGNIVFDNIKVPSILNIFKNSVVINSFSKSHSLPGERIGYIAVNPLIKECQKFLDGMIFCNRTLGFVNAPALFQKVVSKCLDDVVDSNIYRKRRDLLYNKLIDLGFECVKPQGAFYLFPKSPIDDDVEFVKQALKYNVLVVPGKGFGAPGHFRLSYCINLKTIENSFEALEALAKEFIR